MNGIAAPPVTMPDDAGAGLETRRLVLRRYTMADLPALVRINADPEGMRFMGGVLDEEQSRAMLEDRVIAYYEEHPGLGVWATCLRDTGECIGMHCLNHIHGESLIQVGYRLEPAHWGCGYATEMAFALMLYGYVRRGFEQIAAITERDHGVSQRVLEKIGLQRQPDRCFEHPRLSPHNPFAYYERQRGDWLAEFLPLANLRELSR